MVSTAYLRIYQAVETFSEGERARWLIEPHTAAEPPELPASRRWLLSRKLPGEDVFAATEGGFVRTIDGKTYVCPWRTKLRMLSSMVAFRGIVPDEVADAFVPVAEARRAAAELELLNRTSPGLRSHILHANWHVPLRWFAAFDDADRVLTEDGRGVGIRYLSPLPPARARLERAIEILASSWIEEDVIAALKEFRTWVAGFPDDGLLELDYGSVARMFDDDELVEDRSAQVVWSCLEAVESGDVVRAGRFFAELSERWAETRAQEVEN